MPGPRNPLNRPNVRRGALSHSLRILIPERRMPNIAITRIPIIAGVTKSKLDQCLLLVLSYKIMFAMISHNCASSLLHMTEYRRNHPDGQLAWNNLSGLCVKCTNAEEPNLRIQNWKRKQKAKLAREEISLNHGRDSAYQSTYSAYLALPT